MQFLVLCYFFAFAFFSTTLPNNLFASLDRVVPQFVCSFGAVNSLVGAAYAGDPESREARQFCNFSTEGH